MATQDRAKSTSPSRTRQTKSTFDDGQGTGDSSRVVLVIVVLALIFISVVSYFVAKMPPKP